MKNILKILIISALMAICFCFSGCLACTPYDPANAEEFDPSNCEAKDTALTGKTIYWLGSSVTLGMAAMDTAVPDYIAARNNATCVKDAVSGTTLIDNGSDSYVSRLINSKYFDKSAKIDAFVVQISTNDAKGKYSDSWGEVTADDKLSENDFNRQTTAGAMEYIVWYITNTWDCPVYFYSNAYFSDEGERAYGEAKGSDYAAIIEDTKRIAEKWSKAGHTVSVIDLFNDEEFNDISSEDYDFYMYDAVHPYKAGYLKWWTPAIESVLINDFSR